MQHSEIADLKRIFRSRLDTLGHLLDVGERHEPDTGFVGARLAEDMLPLSAQVAFACNQPRGFSQWCRGEAIDNIAPDSLTTLADCRAVIADTLARVDGIDAPDAKLDEVKRIGLGPGRHCELPGRQYVSEYLIPNLYFHVTAAYAILRMRGVPVGKQDFMRYLAPHVRQEG